MAQPPQNSISQLRQTSSDELLSRQRRLLFSLRVLRVTGTILGVGVVVAALTDRGDPGVLLGVALTQVVAAVYARTKLWIIDLILSERGAVQ